MRVNLVWWVVLNRPYLVVLAVPVHHPVLPVGADFQLESGDVVGLLGLLGHGPLCGDARQNLQELEVNLGEKKEEITPKIDFLSRRYIFLIINRIICTRRGIYRARG